MSTFDKDELIHAIWFHNVFSYLMLSCNNVARDSEKPCKLKCLLAFMQSIFMVCLCQHKPLTPPLNEEAVMLSWSKYVGDCETQGMTLTWLHADGLLHFTLHQQRNPILCHVSALLRS